MSDQRLDYKPQISYTSDYSTIAGDPRSVDIMISSQQNEPLDTMVIPSIEENLDYLDIMINYLPGDLARALREVYDPVRDIYYNTLIDKIVDPNLKPPEIIIIPAAPDRPPIDVTPPEEKIIHPIVLRPINFKDPTDPNPPQEDPEDPFDDKNIYPIVLRPIKDSKPGDNDDDNIESVYPIVLKPIYGDIDVPGRPFPPEEEEPIDFSDPLWDAPETTVVYKAPDIKTMVDKEFVFLLSKLVFHYTEKLKGSVNNYYYNGLRSAIGQSEENVKFIANKLAITSNDIVNHSKHLFDSSIKNEDLTKLRTDFFANVFNIKESLTHIQGFFVSNELRKRYTNIDYSVGNSNENSISDFTLKQMNMRYENQYRKSFENLFRYLESSIKVTDDILRLYVQDRSNKSTLLKKGGIK